MIVNGLDIISVTHMCIMKQHLVLAAFLFASSLLLADSAVRNGGFEQGLQNWKVALHGQSFASVSIEKVDYVEGELSLRLQSNETPRVYFCASQYFPLKQENRKIRGSFSYKSPQGGGTFFIHFRGQPKLHSLAIDLPPSNDWKKMEIDGVVPDGATHVGMEIRLAKKGYQLFDALEVQFLSQTDEEAAIDLLFINATSISKVYEECLKEKGFGNIQFCGWDELTARILKRSKCVTIFPMLRLTLTEQDEARIALVRSYAEQGGGVLLNQSIAQMLSSTLLPVRLGDEFGLNIHYGITCFPERSIRNLGKQMGDVYSVHEGPIAKPFDEGVGSMLLPAAARGLDLVGNVPFTGDSNWQTILTAGDGSYEKLADTMSLFVYQNRLKGLKPYENEVPVAGIRPFGKGFVGYIGLIQDCSFRMNDSGKTGRQIAEQVFAKDGLSQFMVNFYKKLSSGASELRQATLPELQEAPKSALQPRLYRGIIGPRTTYSSGRSSVAEYVAAAKAAGLAYVVFLEDFSKLSYENFEALRLECRKYCADGFVALPGFTYENVDGNHQYVYGDQPLYPGDILLDSRRRFKTTEPRLGETSGMDLHYLYTQLSFAAHSGWYDFSHNPYPYYDMRSVVTMGLVTQEDGKTRDFSLEALAGTNRDVQYIWPQALVLMKDAQEMKWVVDGTYYHNQLFATSFEQFKMMLSSTRSRKSRNCYPGIPCFGKMFVSQGPTLTLEMPRGDMNPDGDLYASVLNVWPLKVQAEAPEGIQTIEIYDGIRLIRRLQGNDRKSVSYETILPNDRQRSIWGRLVSSTGRQAVTRSMNSDSWILRDLYCMDRNNPLLYSLQKRKDGQSFLMNYAADGVLPWKGPWVSRVRPVGAFVSDPILGQGKLRYDGSPENHPQMGMRPAFFKDDQLAPAYPRRSWQGPMIPGREGGLHNHPMASVLSSNVMIARQVFDGVFPLDAYPIIHTHASLFPFKKSEYLETTAKKTLWLVKPEGVPSWLWEQDFKILKDYPVTGKRRFFFTPGGVSPRGAKMERAWLDGREVRQPNGLLALKKGDMLCYEGNFFGTLIVYVLSDGLAFDCPASRFVYLANEDTVPAGTTYNLKMLFSAVHRLEKDPFAVALKYGRDLGILEPGKTGYQVNVEQGRMTSNEFTLDVTGPFAGTVKGLKDINGNLGMRLSGMRDNCSAMLACGGRKRLIPVEESTAYAVLTEEEDEQNLIAGHPYLPDSPAIEVMVSADSSYSNWRAEIHNPTDKSITTTIHAHPGLTGGKDEELTLAPGESVIRLFK